MALNLIKCLLLRLLLRQVTGLNSVPGVAGSRLAILPLFCYNTNLVFVVIAHHFGHLSTPYSANVIAFAIMISEGGQPLSFLVADTDI